MLKRAEQTVPHRGRDTVIHGVLGVMGAMGPFQRPQVRRRCVSAMLPVMNERVMVVAGVKAEHQL
jgi:hypothetical protein